METRDSVRQSLEAQDDALDRQMEQVAKGEAKASADADAHIRSQLSALRARLADIQSRLRDKVDADDRASNASLVEIDRALEEMNEELTSHLH